ncbi:MAG: hypothetical protein FWD71_00130 [Oscillospiraceae bacterium]|nr:hypothetical protein [Oscillospiraceae bacterium]
MFSFFHMQAKQIFTGNVLFVVCCGFYLAWWLTAFSPSGATQSTKTNWLLLPAILAGLLGVILIVRGIITKTQVNKSLPGIYILLGGIVAFIILLYVTVSLFKRPATSELLLIIGWGALMLAEINALFGSGLFSHRQSVVFVVIICAAVVISLVCYILYFRLGSRAGYIDGMIPLVLAALTMLAISCYMAIPGK